MQWWYMVELPGDALSLPSLCSGGGQGGGEKQQFEAL